MGVIEEMARDWVKRLCAAQLDYTTRLDLLAVEYARMSDADREAVKTAMGGGGFVVMLSGLPEKILRKYIGERQDVRYGIALKVGEDELPRDLLVQAARKLPVEVIASMICLLGLGAHEAYKEKAEEPLLHAMSVIAKVVLADQLREQAEDLILEAAKRGQA